MFPVILTVSNPFTWNIYGFTTNPPRYAYDDRILYLTVCVYAIKKIMITTTRKETKVCKVSSNNQKRAQRAHVPAHSRTSAEYVLH